MLIMNTRIKKHVLILGSTGLLGSDMLSFFNQQTYTLYSPSRQALNIENLDLLFQYVKTHPADIVINCAAYTQVDQSEMQSNLAFLLNHLAVETLAKACQESKKTLIHFSTDYIFDGEKDGPYIESDSPNPLGVYGKSKWEGEKAIISHCHSYYIFRVQWLYGFTGSNFLKTIFKLGKDKRELPVISDQWGSPTWSMEIVKAIDAVIQKAPSFGIYHFRSLGYTHWAEYAQFIFDTLGFACQVNPILTSEYPRPAKRPLNGRLSIEKYYGLGLYTPLDWKESVRLFLMRYSHLI